MYDAVVAGGSVAGLLCAREIARKGFEVLVIEEDHEIGTPEHCGGLVSLAGLGELGVIPSGRTFGHQIESAVISSPGGSGFAIDASRHGVAEIGRRELDKQIAHQAQRSGATIRVGTTFHGMTDSGIRAGREDIDCQIFVDARGAASLIHRDRTGAMASAQYEIYADWIQRGTVRVIIDQERFPGFFAWVIPSGEGRGRVGVAGRGINAAGAIKEILEEMGSHSIIRRIFAPIWTKGPIPEFVSGNTVIVGDAAGQAKPTTAGGIYTSGMGGIYAGQAIAGFLGTGDRSELARYQERWSERFGGEFERQALARRALERLDNRAIDKLVGSVTPRMAEEMADGGDFDFHTGSIIRMLGIRGTARTAHTLIEGEIRKLIGRHAL